MTSIIIISRVLKSSRWIKCITKLFTSVTYLRTLYIALVISILEYGIVIWYPYLIKISWGFVKLKNKFLSYAQDYTLICNILTLSAYRLDFDACFIFCLLWPIILSRWFRPVPIYIFYIPSYPIGNHTLFCVPSRSTSYR